MTSTFNKHRNGTHWAFLRIRSLALGAILLSLSACNAGNTVPSASAAPSPTVGADPAVATPAATETPPGYVFGLLFGPSGSLYAAFGDAATDDLFGTCFNAVPGKTFVTLSALGTVSIDDFNPDKTIGAASWTKYSLVPRNPYGVGDTGVTGLPPTQMDVQVYTGQYTVFNTNGAVDTTSCFEAVVALNNKSIDGLPLGPREPNNALGQGLVNVPASYDAVRVDSGNFKSFKLSNLSRTTGAGTFTLSNGETGTISLTASQGSTFPVYQKAAGTSSSR